MLLTRRRVSHIRYKYDGKYLKGYRDEKRTLARLSHLLHTDVITVFSLIHCNET